MGNSQHCALLELLCYHLLNQSVVLHIDVSSRLVDQHNLTVLQEGSTDAEELLLAS